MHQGKRLWKSPWHVTTARWWWECGTRARACRKRTCRGCSTRSTGWKATAPAPAAALGWASRSRAAPSNCTRAVSAPGTRNRDWRWRWSCRWSRGRACPAPTDKPNAKPEYNEYRLEEYGTSQSETWAFVCFLSSPCRQGANPTTGAIRSQPIHSAAGRRSGLGAICVAGADADGRGGWVPATGGDEAGGRAEGAGVPRFSGLRFGFRAVECRFRRRSGEPRGGVAEHPGSDRGEADAALQIGLEPRHATDECASGMECSGRSVERR